VNSELHARCPRIATSLLVALFLVLVLNGRGAAGTASTRTELAMLRTAHEISLLRASAPSLRQYAAELTALEKRCATNRDYKGAIAARNERQTIEKEISRIEKEDLLLKTREQSFRSAMLPDQIVLMPEQAVLSGVSREPGNGALTDWKKTGASATWKLPDLPPGGYEVLLRYSCDALEGGSLAIGEQTFSLTGTADTTLKGPMEKNFGTLKITNGSGSLSISARTVLKANLMHLYFVKLVPANR
jgi:hypothetical protein